MPIVQKIFQEEQSEFIIIPEWMSGISSTSPSEELKSIYDVLEKLDDVEQSENQKNEFAKSLPIIEMKKLSKQTENLEQAEISEESSNREEIGSEEEANVSQEDMSTQEDMSSKEELFSEEKIISETNIEEIGQGQDQGQDHDPENNSPSESPENGMIMISEAELNNLVNGEVDKIILQLEPEIESKVEEKIKNELDKKYEDRFTKLIENLMGAYKDQRTVIEHQLIDLSSAIAREMIGRELKESKRYIAGVVKEAISLIADGTEIEITLNHEDHALVTKITEKLIQETPKVPKLVLRADSKITGGCIVETKLARVDATLENRLKTITDALHSGATH